MLQVWEARLNWQGEKKRNLEKNLPKDREEIVITQFCLPYMLKATSIGEVMLKIAKR